MLCCAVEITLLIGIVSLLYIFLKYRQGYWARRGIPHNEPHILRGHAHEWRNKKHITEIFKETYDQFKGQAPFVGFSFLMKHFALILDLTLVKNILIKDFQNFESRGLYFNEKDDPLTGHLFLLDGEKWRRLRHKMSPTFTSGKMKYMFNTVVDVGQELNQVFGDKIKESKDSVLDVSDLLSRFTADVIGSCAFGIECNSLRNPTAEFVEKGKIIFTKERHPGFIMALIQGFPSTARKLGMRVIPQEVHDFYMRIVKETIEYREKNKIQRNDFMDMLIDLKNSPNGLSVEEVAAQAFVFFIAGYETSSTTMSFALYELAANPDIQDKLRKHINDVLAKHGGSLTYECMKDMDYLQQVIDETLRKHPVVGHLVRQAKTRYETGDPKYYIEAEQNVIIPLYGIQHDPEIYPEPEKFIPERFTEEAINSRPACSYLPFGDGPRNCIGLRFGKMQSNIGLSYLIRNYKFSIAKETDCPPAINKVGFVRNLLHGVKLRVEKI